MSDATTGDPTKRPCACTAAAAGHARAEDEDEAKVELQSTVDPDSGEAGPDMVLTRAQAQKMGTVARILDDFDDVDVGAGSTKIPVHLPRKMLAEAIGWSTHKEGEEAVDLADVKVQVAAVVDVEVKLVELVEMLMAANFLDMPEWTAVLAAWLGAVGARVTMAKTSGTTSSELETYSAVLRQLNDYEPALEETTKKAYTAAYNAACPPGTVLIVEGASDAANGPYEYDENEDVYTKMNPDGSTYKDSILRHDDDWIIAHDDEPAFTSDPPCSHDYDDGPPPTLSSLAGGADADIRFLEDRIQTLCKQKGAYFYDGRFVRPEEMPCPECNDEDTSSGICAECTHDTDRFDIFHSDGCACRGCWSAYDMGGLTSMKRTNFLGKLTKDSKISMRSTRGGLLN